MTAPDEKALCRHCGKPESSSKHTRYGSDLDNPVKHEFEPPEQTPPDELTPETLVDYGGPLNSMYEIQKHLSAHAAVWKAHVEALEKENRALRANVSKSVLRRLEGQGVLRSEEERPE